MTFDILHCLHKLNYTVHFLFGRDDRDSRASSEPLAETATAASTVSPEPLLRRCDSASSVISSVSNRISRSRRLLPSRFQTQATKRKSSPYHMKRPWKAYQSKSFRSWYICILRFIIFIVVLFCFSNKICYNY